MENENNNNGGVEKQTQSEMALEVARETQIQIGSKQSNLTKIGSKILSKRGKSVPALIEFLRLPKWLKAAENYDPTSEHKSKRSLCSIEKIASVLKNGAYPEHIKEVRGWLPYAFRAGLKLGAFIVMQPAGHGKQILDNGQAVIHHGETTAVALCPEHPSPVLRELALSQIKKREKTGEMTNKQVTRMRELLGGENEQAA